VDFTISTPTANWLAIDKLIGATPASANISVNPGNLAKGTYTSMITISSSAAGNSQSLAVTLVVRDRPTLLVSPNTLAFNYVTGFPPPLAQTLSISAGDTNFTASASTTPNANWLSISNLGGTTPASLRVSVQPYGLAAGTYSGTILIQSPAASNSPTSIPVKLTVAKTAQLSASPTSLFFDAQFGSRMNQSQTILVSSTGNQISFDANATIGSWLSITPSHATTGTINPGTGGIVNSAVSAVVSIDPTGLPVGTYSGSLAITPSSGASPITVPVTLAVRGNHLRIPQVADGSGWKTTIVLVNTDSEPAPFTLSFMKSDGTSLTMPLDQIGPARDYSDVIPVGGSRTIETQGTANYLSQGWAEVVAAKSVTGTAIFHQRTAANLDTEGAVRVGTGAGKYFLLPFDNTEGFVTSMAILNPDNTQSATVSIVFRDENGQQISTESLLVSAKHRQAFILPSQFPKVADKRGVAEFSSPNVELSAFGLRASPRNALTSIDPIVPDNLPAPGTTATISQVADGGDWETTIILVNTGNKLTGDLSELVPAPFSLRFTQPDGTPWRIPVAGTDGVSEYSDVIPVGGSKIIETGGSTTTLSQGWAQVITSGSIAGTAIFRQRLSADRDAEGAVPLSLSSTRRFVVPFNNTQGFVTAMALVNQDPSQSTAVSVSLRDENGQALGSEVLKLAPLGRSAFVLATLFPETGNTQGVAEFSSTNVDLSALGLLYNPLGSFTSIPLIKK